MTTLLTRLEGAEKGSRELDAEIALQTGWQVFPCDNWIGPEGKIVVPDYTTSVDAALALAERVLPDFDVGFLPRFYKDKPYVGMLSPKGKPVDLKLATFGGGNTLPLAICIAILKASGAGQ